MEKFHFFGKVSGQNLFLDMFPDKSLDKICFRTKPGIFPDSFGKNSFTLEKLMEKNISQTISGHKFPEKNKFLDKIRNISRYYGK